MGIRFLVTDHGHSWGVCIAWSNRRKAWKFRVPSLWRRYLDWRFFRSHPWMR
jgi:hypothetical protein